MLKTAITCFIVALLALTACEESAKPLDPNAFIGRWEVVSATRNERSTGTLTGAFFKFESGLLTTNLPLQEESTELTIPYEIKGQEILLKMEKPLALKVNSITSTDMQLGFVIKGMTFVLNLKPAAEPAPAQDTVPPTPPAE
jgi:hypothetical protein